MLVAMAVMKPEKQIVKVQAPPSPTSKKTQERASPKRDPVYERYELAGVVNGGAYIGSQLVKVGQHVEGYRLAIVDVQNGKTQWIGKDGVTVDWPVGGLGVVSGSRDGLHTKRPVSGTAGPQHPADDQRPADTTQQGENRPS
jgi:hypothetical protein